MLFNPDSSLYSLFAEKILGKNPNIAGAVMFGRGRFNAGVIVAPTQGAAFDPTDLRKLAEFRNLIWYIDFHAVRFSLTRSLTRTSVQEANDFAPTHSRIFKEVGLVCFSIGSGLIGLTCHR
jgi:hypothetical protein